MSETEYANWCIESMGTYKSEIIKSGMSESEAEKKTTEDFKRLLPEGLLSKDQYLFSIKEDGRMAGILWFGVRGAEDNRKAFIYDINLYESERGKGFGKKAMLLLESEVKKLGLKHIGLHVFGHNTIARTLYEKLGYETTNVNMEKKLE
ncbi:MAG: GNAT family N-acetyltransferase [Bacteriovorax sp.]|jgi:ribosomal protein S18 acetylase RimI-like enzyme